LIEDAREDPDLFSKIDVDALLDSLESPKNEYLEDETFESIALSVVESMKAENIARPLINEFCQKLTGYRHVPELHLLHKGKYVRWIRKTDKPTLMRGGVLVDVKFGSEGANILCRATTGKFIQYRFDLCITYQKLTDEEHLILMLYENS
jgi:hypothetical protein